MKILLVAATDSEIEPLVRRFVNPENSKELLFANAAADVLITGVGMVATAYALGRQLALNEYDLAVNAGIAGSFDFNLKMGQVVRISEDVFAEQGAEDGEAFLSLNELGFGPVSQVPFPFLRNSFNPLPINIECMEKLENVKAITVNKVHGHELTIAKTLARFKAQVESMEGAAFFYACNQSKTPCIQVRAISNYVEPRDKEKWQIRPAVTNLNNFLTDLFVTA